jgi:hypothetical protein
MPPSRGPLQVTTAANRQRRLTIWWSKALSRRAPISARRKPSLRLAALTHLRRSCQLVASLQATSRVPGTAMIGVTFHQTAAQTRFASGFLNPDGSPTRRAPQEGFSPPARPQDGEPSPGPPAKRRCVSKRRHRACAPSRRSADAEGRTVSRRGPCSRTVSFATVYHGWRTRKNIAE